eukprot:4875959-Pyramimonas_sp.AAC.1
MWRQEGDVEKRKLLGRFISTELGNLSKQAALKKTQEILERPGKGGLGKSKSKRSCKTDFQDDAGGPVSTTAGVEHLIRDHLTCQFSADSAWPPPSWVFQRASVPEVSDSELQQAIH